MTLLQKGNTPNISTEVWLCNSVEEINSIPASAPPFSMAIVLTDDGMVIKAKNNNNQWKDL